MSSSSRFLIGFGIFIVVIIAVAVAIAVLAGNHPVKMLPENTPEGTVQRFLAALKDGDCARATTFLEPQAGSGSFSDFNQWVRSRQQSGGNNSTWQASIVKSKISGDNATVELSIDVFSPGGPLTNPVSTSQTTFFLDREGGTWLIQQPVYLWWIY